LCTGSGVLSLFAAEKARRVIGTDINRRAIEFASLNAQLNGVGPKIELRLGDLFEPVGGMRFDAILANPPFEPTPKGWPRYLHSDGGEDGLSVTRQIIERIPEYLEPFGSFQMVAWLSEDFVSVLDQLRRAFGAERVAVRSLFNFSMSDYIRHRMRESNLPRGRPFLLPSKSSESVHYVYVHVVPSNSGFHRQKEVYQIGKTISATGAVV